MPAVSRRQFDYTVPERWQRDMREGSRVRVPFHGRRVGAWVVEVGVTPPPGVLLRAVTGVSGHGPPPSVLALAQWGAWRWAMPVAALLRIASPERNVWSLPVPPASARRSPGSHARAVPRARAAGSSRRDGVTLRRVAPAHDVLPWVLEAIEGSCGPVLVLAPSTGWAGRLSERLRARGVDVASNWAEAAAGWPVVVGSRAAAWAPVPVLGAAVVLDAHDYHDRYDAADVVVERAARDGAPCLLISPCPTVVQRERYGPAVVPERSVERSGWPAVTVVDRRSADPRTGMLSDELVQLARRVLPGRLVCVLHRTGRARLLACVACGALARCAACGRPVVSTRDLLHCRTCGADRPMVCGDCGSVRLKVLRQGVSRVREELAALLGTPVGEVAGTPADAPVPATSVLVGTEAVLHRVRHAAAVAFLDFDQHLLAPRFCAGEESLVLLARAARLVGGRGSPHAQERARGSGGEGTVLVQTRVPDHDVLRAAVAGDPDLFTERELRRELRLPPFSALAAVRSCAVPVLAPEAEAGVEVSPLAPGRWLLRAPDHRTLCDAVATLHGGVNVDPVDV